MLSDILDSSSVREDIQVLLDGHPINLPPGRRSLLAIRSYLETLALQRQRVLSAFTVDGEAIVSNVSAARADGFSRIEAETFDLDEMPLRLLEMAIQQTAQAERQLLSAISMVLINDGQMAREFWWDLTRDLKQPLITLTLMPNHACGHSYSGASVSQLRKWQLQQLGAILMEVDHACHANDPLILAAALETRVMSWIANLKSSLDLLRETLLTGLSAGLAF